MKQTGKKPPRDIEAHLDRIRRTGYEKSASYLVKGIINISFPIFDERRSPLGALTVPYIQHSEAGTNASEVIEALRRATSEISTAIGGRPQDI
jgi:DNA-binding IclR family transcriptional regulator